MRLPWTTLLLLGPLSGCFPVYSTYFEPKSEGSVVTRPYCHGKVGVPSLLRYDLEQGSLYISADRVTDHPDKVQLEIYLTLRPGPVVTWHLNLNNYSLLVGSKLRSTPLSPEKARIEGQWTEEIPESVRFRFKNSSALILLQAQLGSEKEFELQLPAIDDDGLRLPAHRITFVEHKGSYTAPLNC